MSRFCCPAATSDRRKAARRHLQTEIRGCGPTKGLVARDAHGKNIPPFLILHMAEHPETKAQSQSLAKALEDAGIAAQAYPSEWKNDGTINSEQGSPNDKPTQVLFGVLDGVLRK